jgi:hypothetical protein
LRHRSSKCWAEFGGPRFHRDPTAELPTRQAPRGFLGASTAATLSLVSPRQWGDFLRSQSNERHWVAARGRSSLLADIDRFCGQIAAAIHSSELQLYATLGLIVVLSALLFPPKDDPDQV